MFSMIRTLFRELVNEGSDSGRTDDQSIKLATAALLCEVSRADRHYDAREEEAKILLLQRLLGLPEAESRELLQKALVQTENAISLFDFTNKLRSLTQPQRFELIKAMWEVAYADNELDPMEEAIIRNVADLIYLDHADFIRAKLAATANKQ